MPAPSPYLAALAKRHPTTRAALAEIAKLEAVLTLPAYTVHVVSDVHGEHVKFRHVVNNASGSLRPRLEKLFGARVSPAELNELLSFFYYPLESWEHATSADASPNARRALLLRLLPRAIDAMRDLARGYTLGHVQRILPDPLDSLYLELLFAPELGRAPAYLGALIEPFVREGRDLELWRLTARAVRNLSVGELVVAGDLGDRGPRIDKVIEIMQKQPSVAITWGNHDASWMGACLGHPALMATVLRLSLRYRRLSQLEEGYGVIVAPLEHLAQTVYGDDPAAQFACKGEGLRDPQTMARMQKAAAVLQFKLEGQLIRRHPEWQMESRALLHRMNLAAGTIEIDGKTWPLLDRRFPTIDPADPYRLSADEEKCLARVRQSFVGSSRLWEHMSFVARAGSMWLRRDQALIFHGCLPVDAFGEHLALDVDGAPRKGKELFDALGRVVTRCFRGAPAESDLDWLWYLWTGPRSPCFGKDRMATLETYLVADKATHKEEKNPYFKLIHEPSFCEKILREFGVDPAGLIVNGHVPVKPEKGESPLKSGGKAITIDGAFAAAYGDRGYSLVLDSERIWLAEHHHFPGKDESVATGADIVPTVSDIRVHARPRTVGDTERGESIRAEIAVLDELVRAYADGTLREAEAS